MMNKIDCKIHIIGAGISGLIAAQCLEEKGYSPVIIEATDSVGGRVKTDVVDGYQLDHGFQVLLSSYPEASKYLDYSKLELQKLSPGAVIFEKNKTHTLGDPFRDLKLLVPTILFNKASFSDKLKIFKLNNLLKNKDLDKIFNDTNISTKQFLTDFGFSKKFIYYFFKPFFSGIFLETQLETSSRMFQFIFKMFKEGYAVIPKKGMGEIPNQLKSNLNKTEFIFNTKVKSFDNNTLILDNNAKIESDYTIITIDPSSILDIEIPKTNWKSCDTLYFETTNKLIKKPLIGLIPNDDLLINNIFYVSSISSESKGINELLSVTIVKNHNFKNDELIKIVKKELNDYCGIKNVTFLKHYSIKNALPVIKNVKYTFDKSKISEKLFLAGDIQLNGSLNAAIKSGENAANSCIRAINDC
jgi:protoporphyrinogen oxidase